MVVDLAYGFFVYGMALGSFFTVAPGVFRPVDAVTAHLPAMFGGTLLAMVAATLIYAKGYEGKNGLGEGVRFGLLAGLLLAGYFAIAGSATMNYGLKLAAIMALASIPEWLLVGATIGLLYKPAAQVAGRATGV
jgi:hypothetical protein